LPLSQLYGRWARVFADDGTDITPASVAWHENDLAQRLGPSAWYVLDDDGIHHARERVDAARARGRYGARPSELAVPDAARVTRRRARVGGRHPHDRRRARRSRARVCSTRTAFRSRGSTRRAWMRAGVATGGYASGLAQAPLLGLAAAEELAA